MSKRTYPDFSGTKFGRLFAEYRYIDESGRTMYHCKCDCGNEKNVWCESLKSGKTKSCGCLRAETTSRRNTTHGMRKTRLYRIWLAMKNRCLNPNSNRYQYYGGKGVKICDSWVSNFLCFYNWAVKNGYRDDLTIDRIDSDKNYCPENCRWATYAEQEHNKKRYANAPC
jgi:hypothetical protein